MPSEQVALLMRVEELESRLAMFEALAKRASRNVESRETMEDDEGYAEALDESEQILCNLAALAEEAK